MSYIDFYAKNIPVKINADLLKLEYLSNHDIHTCDYEVLYHQLSAKLLP